MQDLLIIGSGPAGVSAALSARARNLDFLWFGSRSLSQKIEKAERIINYPGLPGATGVEMRDAFLRQTDGLGIEILEERVNSIYDMGGYYTAVVNEKMYDGKTVILATGVSNSREIPGESRLLGKGVSYCATCDGELYRGKRIAVVCTDPSQEEEIGFLAGLAAEVFLCAGYKDCGVRRENVRHMAGYPSEILGGDRASGIVCGGETVEVDGIFCLRPCVAPAALLPGLAAEGGHIQVDRRQRTNLPGCFAAGDCTGRPYQYAKAVGEGNVALHSALDYLKSKDEPSKQRRSDMRSRVLQVKDYREVDVRPLLKPFAPDEATLETELRRLTNPYIRWEEGTAVSAGDQVLCRLASDCPRFNKEKVRFVAGSGMFHRELEALATGMTVGETREAVLPEGKVALTLAGVMNRIVPEASDEMVEKLGLEGVGTVPEYRDYLLAQQKEAAFQEALFEPQEQLLRTVISGSEFVLSREDWAAVVDRELDRCRALCRQEGMVLEEMTPEQFRGRIPVRSYQELVAMTQYDGWDRLCRYLLGRWYAQADGFQAGDYEEFIADYVRTWHVSEENAREANTLENFLFNEYAGHTYKVLADYIREFY